MVVEDGVSSLGGCHVCAVYSGGFGAVGGVGCAGSTYLAAAAAEAAGSEEICAHFQGR